MEIERGIGDNNPPVSPENMVRIPADAIPAFLTEEFADLKARADEFVAAIARWMDDHDGGKVAIADDAEHVILTDWLVQMRQFSGPTGEVEEVRQRIAAPIHALWKAVNQWFGDLRSPIEDSIGPARGARIGTLNYAQADYLIRKQQAERAERERLAREAQVEAERLQREAAAAAAAESAAPNEDTREATDAAVQEAADGVYRAQLAQHAVMPTDHSRFRTARASVGLASTWTYEIEDIRALAEAVAQGKAPVTFLTVNDRAIKAAINDKAAPMRSVPGLRIFEQFNVSRRAS